MEKRKEPADPMQDHVWAVTLDIKAIRMTLSDKVIVVARLRVGLVGVSLPDGFEDTDKHGKPWSTQRTARCRAGVRRRVPRAVADGPGEGGRERKISGSELRGWTTKKQAGGEGVTNTRHNVIQNAPP